VSSKALLLCVCELVTAVSIFATELLGFDVTQADATVGVTQLIDPGEAHAVNTLPLFVVLVAGTCKFPSPVG